MSLFDTGIRPLVDEWLLNKAKEERDYGNYWSASTAGYCMRRNIFERLKVPYVKEDARKQRVFAVGDIFHQWMQEITKNAGISIAQELELQDEELMIRGHIDDLVLVDQHIKPDPELLMGDHEYVGQKLILYDYKSVSSRSFSYSKGRPMSFYHHMQLGTYMYMLRRGSWLTDNGTIPGYEDKVPIEDGRILRISKDDLRMEEQQLMWTPDLEKEVVGYWRTLNGYWKAQKIPKCTCADFEGGFLAKEAYNPYFYQGSPCSIDWYNKHKEESNEEN